MSSNLQDCPGCGVRLRLPPVEVASIFRCPRCGEKIRIGGGPAGDGPGAATGSGADPEPDRDRRPDRRERAEQIIQNHVLWSVGAGLVPLPLLDIAAVTGIQLDMLKQLCSLYRVRYSESQGKSWVASLGGSIMARMGASVVKSVPVIGTLLGGVSMAALSGAATYALGRVTVQEFENGADLDSVDAERVRDAYEEELERGKEMASRFARNRETAQAFDKLEKLAQLREKGIVTPEEFEERKKKLLDDL